LFVGINPGLRSAEVGHHFAGYSNRFWKLLYQSDLVPHQCTYKDDWRLPEWGLGLTNIVSRPTAGINALRPNEYARGRRRLLALVTRYSPAIVALLGVTIYRVLFAESTHRQVRLGLQDKCLGSARIYVLPNPSGRNAHYPYERMLTAFRRLQKEARSQRPRIMLSFPPGLPRRL
ncbi:MAG: mismatch-specific DNA-glycosylase, partial [Nitrospira sp.]|nr:mismatch-specific DNA-glycosylase [Nitrospira sp.]